MTFPDLPPGPWQDQEADLAAEVEALAGERQEPSAEELAGLAEPSEVELADLEARLDAELARLRDDPGDDRGGSAPVFGGGFAEGGVLDQLGPGPALAGFSHGVLDEGLGALSDDELVGVLRASRRLAAWQDGIEIVAVTELDARRARAAARAGSSLTDEHVSAELAAALVLTGRSADALLGLARDLARLPAVQRALLAGRIDLPRARIFAEELVGLGDVAAAAVATGFASEAGSMTTGQLRAALRAMVLRLDPAAVRRRMDKARDEARVEAWLESSGNGGLAGRELPAADAIAADKRISAIARALHSAGAPGTLDQLRAAVFVAVLAGRDPETLLPPVPGNEDGACDPAARPSGGSGPGGSGPGGSGPGGSGLAGLTGSVQLVMPAAAWLGLSDAPGEAPGLGSLDAWTCRDLAAWLSAWPGARWSVTLTGRDGQAVAHAAARTGPGPPDNHVSWLGGLRFDWLERGTCCHTRQEWRYEPGSRLRNLVRARQRRCSFPGCRRPAVRGDLDHTVPYDQGGRTCECNLSPLCRMHHHVKQADGWTLTQPEPGVLTWATPHGRTYTVTPEPYPV
jgi:hypothetical protein